MSGRKKRQTTQQKRITRARYADKHGRTYSPAPNASEDVRDAIAHLNAIQAWDYWIGTKAPEHWLVAFNATKRAVSLELLAARKKAQRAAMMDRKRNAARDGRMARQSDGTLTRTAIKSMIKAAKTCPYCGKRMAKNDASLDHITPIARGGIHGTCNVLICCRSCNTRKNDMPFDRWLKAIDPACVPSAEAAFRKATGSDWRQGSMPLFGVTPSASRR